MQPVASVTISRLFADFPGLGQFPGPTWVSNWPPFPTFDESAFILFIVMLPTNGNLHGFGNVKDIFRNVCKEWKVDGAGHRPESELKHN